MLGALSSMKSGAQLFEKVNKYFDPIMDTFVDYLKQNVQKTIKTNELNDENINFLVAKSDELKAEIERIRAKTVSEYGALLPAIREEADALKKKDAEQRKQDAEEKQKENAKFVEDAKKSGRTRLGHLFAKGLVKKAAGGGQTSQAHGQAVKKGGRRTKRKRTRKRVTQKK
jgi:hypothetical protein